MILLTFFTLYYDKINGPQREKSLLVECLR